MTLQERLPWIGIGREGRAFSLAGCERLSSLLEEGVNSSGVVIGTSDPAVPVLVNVYAKNPLLFIVGRRASLNEVWAGCWPQIKEGRTRIIWQNGKGDNSEFRRAWRYPIDFAIFTDENADVKDVSHFTTNLKRGGLVAIPKRAEGVQFWVLPLMKSWEEVDGIGFGIRR